MFFALCGIWVVAEIIIAVVTRTKSGGTVLDRGSMLIMWIVNTAAITACQWIGAVQKPTAGAWLLPLSMVMMIIGLAIRWTAVLSLGKSFSANVAIRDQQQLKNDGLYRWMRHPSYTGLLLVYLAIGLHTQNWISLLVVMVPTTAALLYRISIEETALRSAFGQQYVAYSQVTKRLLPGVF